MILILKILMFGLLIIWIVIILLLESLNAMMLALVSCDLLSKAFRMLILSC